MIDWRGKRVPLRAAVVRTRVNVVTGRPVCALCAAPIEHLSAQARFCSHRCRSRWHAGRRP